MIAPDPPIPERVDPQIRRDRGKPGCVLGSVQLSTNRLAIGLGARADPLDVVRLELLDETVRDREAVAAIGSLDDEEADGMRESVRRLRARWRSS